MIDLHFWLEMLLSSAIVVWRSALIATAHNECIDTNFHLRLGFRHLLGDPAQLIEAATDPPLGQMLLCLPMVASGCTPDKTLHPENWPSGWPLPGIAPTVDPPLPEQQAEYHRLIRRQVLYGNRLSPETLLLLIGVWKALLFMPAIAIAFLWSRQLWGVSSAWLATALLTLEPTIAGNVPVIALDTLALSAILVACYCFWRYFQRESLARLAAAAVAMAAAMLIKHTAIILPAIFALFALWHWVIEPRRAGIAWLELRKNLRARINILMTLGLIWGLALWALLLFDYSRPNRQFHGLISYEQHRSSPLRDWLLSALERKWPAGAYVGSLASGYAINRGGQNAFLWGQIKAGGWWYYFPVLATYKVPIGVAIVLVLGATSLLRVRPTRAEISLLLPMAAFTVFLLTANINYSFRHFLPAYAFMLIWASRCAAGGKVFAVLAWAGVAAAVVHVTMFHPDYLSYINFPRKQMQYQITDSNLDWGQSIRQIAGWLKEKPPPGRKVYLHPRADGNAFVASYYLGESVKFLARGKPPPSDGILIISPVRVCGVYEDPLVRPYDFLKTFEPIDWVGQSMPVYDLSKTTP